MAALLDSCFSASCAGCMHAPEDMNLTSFEEVLELYQLCEVEEGIS